MSLTLEVCEGRFLYAAAEKNSGSYGEMGERFWLRYDGAVLSSEPGDQRREGGETLLLIEDGVITRGDPHRFRPGHALGPDPLRTGPASRRQQRQARGERICPF